MGTRGPSGSMKAGSSGLESVSRAHSASSDDHVKYEGTNFCGDAKEANGKVYKLCGLPVKKNELMEGVGGTHGLRSRRKKHNVDWLVRVFYSLECCDHPILPYCGVVALLEKHE